MSCSFIALGSNLDNPLDQVERALIELNHLTNTDVVACSPWYQSKAVGPGNQPDYINGVAQLETHLSPSQLLTALQSIENAHLRKREQRWGARTLDLDILLYEDQCINTAELIVPHPRMTERDFVLYPLHDIKPGLKFPNGDTLQNIITDVDAEGLHLVKGNSSPTMRH